MLISIIFESCFEIRRLQFKSKEAGMGFPNCMFLMFYMMLYVFCSNNSKMKL